MTDKVKNGKGNIIRRIFDNDFTREVARSFMDPDDVLELKLNEICSVCPQKQSGAAAIELQKIETCRQRYFGCLLQSFVGKAGDDEIKKLYALQNKCETCRQDHTDRTSVVH